MIASIVFVCFVIVIAVGILALAWNIWQEGSPAVAIGLSAIVWLPVLGVALYLMGKGAGL